MLISIQSAGVTLEVNLRITQARKHVRDVPWLWNPVQTSPEVQNSGISGPMKKTYVLQIVFLKIGIRILHQNSCNIFISSFIAHVLIHYWQICVLVHCIWCIIVCKLESSRWSATKLQLLHLNFSISPLNACCIKSNVKMISVLNFRDHFTDPVIKSVFAIWDTSFWSILVSLDTEHLKIFYYLFWSFLKYVNLWWLKGPTFKKLDPFGKSKISW